MVHACTGLQSAVLFNGNMSAVCGKKNFVECPDNNI